MFLSLSLLWKVCGTSHLPTTANNVPELFAYVTATSHGLSLCPSLTFIWKLSLSLSLSLSHTTCQYIPTLSATHKQILKPTNTCNSLKQNNQILFVRKIGPSYHCQHLPPNLSLSHSLSLSDLKTISCYLSCSFSIRNLPLKTLTLDLTHPFPILQTHSLSLFHRWTNRGQPQRQKHLSRQIKVSH